MSDRRRETLAILAACLVIPLAVGGVAYNYQMTAKQERQSARKAQAAREARDARSKQPSRAELAAQKARAAQKGAKADRTAGGAGPAARKERGSKAKGDGTKPNVLMFVMDTVRAESTSLCGYDRPTTPFLSYLKDKKGAAVACQAYSPAPWTLPSHASYFTGVTPPVHGVNAATSTYATSTKVLAEQMEGQGYQTLFVGGNPVLSARSGIARGFDNVVHAGDLVDLRGEDLVKAVQGQIDLLDPKQPVFAFVNFIDAHDPYPEIPAGVGWVPARPELTFDIQDKTESSPYHRFQRGEMHEREANSYISAVRDGYDYGIYEADVALRGVIGAFRSSGWLENDYRVVVTSDHGEFIGEQNLLRHGCFTWEPVVNVPFLFFDSAAEEQITLPEPFSAINAFYLARDGKLPAEAVDATSFSRGKRKDVKVGRDMVSLWTDQRTKLYWDQGDLKQTDLSTDPEELNIRPLQSHPALDRLKSHAKQHEAMLAMYRGKPVDDDQRAALEALGYLE